MRDHIIDYYRALAVILVTVYHIQMGIGNGTYALLYGFDLYAPLNNGWIGVGIFFIISGYCMGASTARDLAKQVTFKNSSIYLLKRFIRIAPAYYVSIVVWCVLINVFSITKKPTGMFDIVTHSLFIHNLIPETLYSINGPYWSIGVEMQFYFLLPFIIIIANSMLKKLALLCVCAVMTYLVYNSGLGEVYKVGLANYLSLFVAGWIMYEYKESIFSFLNRMKCGPALLILAFIMLFYKGNGYSNHEKLYEVAVSTAFGLSMIYFSGKSASAGQGYIEELTSLIGRASFSIYLYNYIFYAVRPSQYNMFSGFILLVTVIGFGILMYNVVEVKTERVRKKLFSFNRSAVNI